MTTSLWYSTLHYLHLYIQHSNTLGLANLSRTPTPTLTPATNQPTMPVPPPPPPQRACPFHTLPPELLLSIISAAPFTPADFLALHLTCRRFHEVLTQHETPIAINTKRRTFSSRTIALFPGLENHDLRSVRRLWSRVRELEEVHERWVEVTTSSSSGRGDGGGEGELTWLQSRFEGIHKAGLLLLYRMHDLHLQQNHPDPTSAEPPICTHCTRTVFLPSLPATSLATILFTLISSVRILRVHGPEPVNARWGTGDVERRSDVELVCEEMILEHGVWIFLALLRGDVEGKDTTGAVEYVSLAVS